MSSWFASRKGLSICAVVACIAVLGIGDGKACAASGGPHLVRDIDTAPLEGLSSSSPYGFVTVGDVTYFYAYTPTTGYELWRTDGTEAGTTLVKDLNPGTADWEVSCLVVADGLLYFTTQPMFGGMGPPELREFVLWRSDGTALGTVPVKRIGGLRNSEEHCDIVASGGSVYFLVFRNDPDFHAVLWKSDGSEDGTAPVTEFDGVTQIFDSEMVAANGVVYFSVQTTANGPEPWRSDGTREGTFLLRDIGDGPIGSLPLAFTPVGNRVCFDARTDALGFQLWCSDGTEAGTQMIFAAADLGGTTLGGFFYVSATVDGEVGLWRTDGSLGGTELVRGGSASVMTEFDGAVFLWEPGTPSSTIRLLRWDRAAGAAEVSTVPGTEIRAATVVNGQLVFTLRMGPDQSALWRSDGTAAGTVLAYDTSDAPVFYSDGHRLYSLVTDPVFGQEPWVDDTLAGRRLLRNIAPEGAITAGSRPTELMVTNGLLYFIADDQLWRSDGTEIGTVLVKDVLPGAQVAFLSDLTSFKGALYFSTSAAAQTPGGLWTSDGTEAGTHEVVVQSDSRARDLTPVGARLFYVFERPPLGSICSLDGSSTPPTCVGRFEQASELTPMGDEVFFVGRRFPPGNPDIGRALWKTDGTVERTLPIQGPSNVSDPHSLVAADGRLFFVASDDTHGPQIWRSDGTDAGTVRVTSLTNTFGYPPINLTALGNRVFFVAAEPDSGYEAWVSDGTLAGTHLIKDIDPGPEGTTGSMIAFGDRMLFAADDGVHGTELWVTDGSEEGTTLIADLFSGPIGSEPRAVAVVNDRVLFAANDEHGVEAWITDGSAAGTRRLSDIAVGAASSEPDQFTALGSLALFTADDIIHGRELWAISLTNMCVGDCNGDGRVAVDELVTGVGMALATRPLSACPEIDGDANDTVSIDELVSAVRSALEGCG